MIVFVILLTVILTAIVIVGALHIAQLTAAHNRMHDLLEDVQETLRPFDYDNFTDIKLRVNRELER